jgi:hypothetical protein
LFHRYLLYPKKTRRTQLSKPVKQPFARDEKTRLPSSASSRKRKRRRVVLRNYTWHAENSFWLVNLPCPLPRLHLLSPRRSLFSFLLLLLLQQSPSLGQRKWHLLLLLFLHHLHHHPCCL